MQLIRQSHAGNLIHNDKTGFFEVWHNGRKCYEILTVNKNSAVEAFRAFAGETWEPTGDQGTI